MLCKYGIEYVDDPATGKKIPTCHRSGFDSVLEDDDFAQAQENADVQARKVQWEEAKTIESLRRGIIEVSGKEAPYDIFICYKETAENGDRTLDSVLAQDIYDALVEKGYRVFFSRVTLEDKLGQEYEPYIFAALNSAKIMLAVGTDREYYNAVWVKNEWSRFLQLIAAGQKKVLIPCFKNLDPYDMPKEFAKLQSQDLGKVGAMQDLLRGIEKIMGGKAEAASPAQQVVVQGGGPNVASLLKRGQLFLEDKNWQSADEYFDKVLDIDPECAEAYLGKVLAERRLSDRAAFEAVYMDAEDRFASDRHLARARQYAGAELAQQLGALDAAWKQKRNDVEEAARKKKERFMAAIQQITGKLIGAGSDHTVGLWPDGTAAAVGDNEHGQCDVGEWTDITAVAAGGFHTVGLKSDGTVVATQYIGKHSYSGQCDVSGWRDIVAVAVGSYHTVGLKSNGTVVAVGLNKDGQCNVSGWRDIVAVAAGSQHTVGLKSDGTVVATKYIGKLSYRGQCDVDDWRDIVAVAASDQHTVGLKSDGTVVAVGYGLYGACDVSGWTDIVAVSTGDCHTVGLRSDGTVAATKYTGEFYKGQCDVDEWTDIVAVAAGFRRTMGLKSDGTMVTAGSDSNGQCNVSDWRLFNSLDTLAQERETFVQATEAARRAEEERQRAEEETRRAEEEAKKQKLEQERADLQTELANLKGLFSGKRRKEIEARLAEIERSLK